MLELTTVPFNIEIVIDINDAMFQSGAGVEVIENRPHEVMII